jgi:hypothetical protein
MGTELSANLSVAHCGSVAGPIICTTCNPSADPFSGSRKKRSSDGAALVTHPDTCVEETSGETFDLIKGVVCGGPVTSLLGPFEVMYLDRDVLGASNCVFCCSARPQAIDDSKHCATR